MALQSGTRLGPYEIESPLGAGAMGEVYKALDTRLDRIVAIKQLTPEHRERFEREARAIAALNHPNICQVYDVGPDYLVLEYLEGQPVRGPLPPEDAVRIAIQIAGALQAAHERGILHRDLKPANIMVTAGGTAKLLDFGVAKRLEPAADVTETTPGAVLGTPAYMSPEQVEGQSVDARSDIFSFGAVLYEILAGRRPFAGNTTSDVIAAILRDDPSPLGGPPALERVVMRCLAKRPPDRYQTMAEVSRALEDASLTPAMRPPSIAVLPFANLSGDRENEYFSDGLTEEIITELARIPGLKVIARTSAFAFKGRNEDVRRIAEALGVTKVLEGSVRRAGERIRVTAQLISAADGTHMWSERYDRSTADVFAIQDDIAQSIAKAFRVKMAKKAGLHAHTPALPAYEAFLRARELLFRFTPDSWVRAKGWLDQAIELDPAYADPHMELGLGYFLQGFGAQLLRDVAPTIRAEAHRALALNPSDPQPHILLGSVAAAHDYDWNEAADRFRDALRATPVSADTRWAYATVYLSAFGRFEESAAEMQRAVERDPLNAVWRAVWSDHLACAGKHDRAIEEGLKAVELDESHFAPHVSLGQACLASGRLEQAVDAFERAHRAAPGHPIPLGLLAGSLVQLGDKDRAAELIRQMGNEPLPVWGRALYHLVCGEIDAAADWFETMLEHREPFAVVYVRSPIVRPLRESPRWRKIAETMHLSELD
jgi:TolB-like protein/Tfp pilus assembly protein PilF/predicted Ser/Thr protein kinase